MTVGSECGARRGIEWRAFRTWNRRTLSLRNGRKAFCAPHSIKPENGYLPGAPEAFICTKPIFDDDDRRETSNIDEWKAGNQNDCAITVVYIVLSQTASAMFCV